jgi:hypothetical protein
LPRGEGPRRKPALVDARRSGVLTSRGSCSSTALVVPPSPGRLHRCARCCRLEHPWLAGADGGDAERFVSYLADDVSFACANAVAIVG